VKNNQKTRVSFSVPFFEILNICSGREHGAYWQRSFGSDRRQPLRLPVILGIHSQTGEFNLKSAKLSAATS